MPALAKPQTRADLLRLMEEHAAKRIKWHQLYPTGLCDEDIMTFRYRYFPARRSFSMEELIIFVDHDHRLWPTIVLGVVRVLKDRGIVDPDCRVTELIKSEVPTESLLEYFVRRSETEQN